jgi:hypothetical protein
MSSTEYSQEEDSQDSDTSSESSYSEMETDSSDEEEMDADETAVADLEDVFKCLLKASDRLHISITELEELTETDAPDNEEANEDDFETPLPYLIKICNRLLFFAERVDAINSSIAE